MRVEKRNRKRGKIVFDEIKLKNEYLPRKLLDHHVARTQFVLKSSKIQL